MAISINWATKVISIPRSFTTLISGSLYELDVNAFRLALKDLEDDATGMGFLDTHRHNTQVTLSGMTLARVFEVINGYTITFEDLAYSVRCVGANHNIGDVKNVNQVSLIIGNTAGLITVDTGGSAPSAATIATAVRAELAVELARIDAATSTRTTAPGVRTELATELARIDVAISTRSDPADIVPANIVKVNNVAVTGTGATPPNNWRPV